MDIDRRHPGIVILFLGAISLGVFIPAASVNPVDDVAAAVPTEQDVDRFVGTVFGTRETLGRLVGADESRPNIIIIDIDRLTASHMPCYGYPRNTTPTLCGFGERNVLFTDAAIQGSWTAQSVASLFTGQYPGVHGLLTHTDELPENRRTLAEVLREAGYTTEAFPVTWENDDPAFLDSKYNLDQGFDRYGNGSRFIKEHVKTLRSRHGYATKEPFFMYVQGFGPHRYDWWGHPQGRKDVGPFTHNYTGILNDSDSWTTWHTEGLSPADIVRRNGTYYLPRENWSDLKLSRRDVDYVINRYDDALWKTDRDVRALFDVLREKNVYSDSIIVVTANHGEVLDTHFLGNDERFGHGALWDDDIRVPLMARIPDVAHTAVSRQVELIDVFPTLLRYAQVPVSDGLERRLQGDSLRPLYAGEGTYTDEYAFLTSYNANMFGARNATWKLHVVPGGGGDMLYNLKQDPGEQIDVHDNRSAIAETMSSFVEEQRLRNLQLRQELY